MCQGADWEWVAGAHSLRALRALPDRTLVTDGPGIDYEVVGWRAGCTCGWQGTNMHRRSRWFAGTGIAPDALYESVLRCEWELHLTTTPESAPAGSASSSKSKGRQLVA